MSNSKISALTSATTPLAGTETLPIVQSSTTKQVSVANLTAGRTQTSNGIVQGTSATGYNFTANTPAAGMTSQLLNWYEEGTWTPTLSAFTGTITTPGARTATYTRVGRNVTLSIDAAITVNGTASVILFVSGMPFTGNTSVVSYYAGAGGERSLGIALYVEYQPANARLVVSTTTGLYPGGNNTRFIISITYQV